MLSEQLQNLDDKYRVSNRRQRKATTIFGCWPSLHDAEVLELHFWRGDVQTDKGSCEFPVLTL